MFPIYLLKWRFFFCSSFIYLMIFFISEKMNVYLYFFIIIFLIYRNLFIRWGIWNFIFILYSSFFIWDYGLVSTCLLFFFVLQVKKKRARVKVFCGLALYENFSVYTTGSFTFVYGWKRFVNNLSFNSKK